MHVRVSSGFYPYLMFLISTSFKVTSLPSLSMTTTPNTEPQSCDDVTFKREPSIANTPTTALDPSPFKSDEMTSHSALNDATEIRQSVSFRMWQDLIATRPPLVEIKWKLYFGLQLLWWTSHLKVYQILLNPEIFSFNYGTGMNIERLPCHL